MKAKPRATETSQYSLPIGKSRSCSSSSSMDSIRSFKGYGKVDHELEEQAFRNKTLKRRLIIIVSSVLLVALIVGAVVGTVIHRRNSNGSSSSSSSLAPSEPTPAATVKAVCSATPYPDSCFSSITALETSNTSDPEVIFKLSLRAALNELGNLKDYPYQLIQTIDDAVLKEALTVCADMLDDAVDRLNDSISSMTVAEGQKILTPSKIEDMKTWLSTAITDQETCLDALLEWNNTKHFNYTLLQQVRTKMESSSEYSSNSLAIVARIMKLLSDLGIPIHKRRRLLGLEGFDSSSSSSTVVLSGGGGGGGGFPAWVRVGERRLLQESNPTPNVTVAKDGSGNFTTIGEAVAAIPKKSTSRFIIYVKEGEYEENVALDKNTWNVMFYGDGKTKTVVKASKNFVDGTPTFATATFAVAGKGFIARDMKFMNAAGPEKHQAVAFRSGSDMSVYYRCAFDAFQDTLYPHSNRQFYSECDVTGTIDFIFGNAVVVFQKCNIQPRQPMPNQFNTITAQGKKVKDQNSGISIQKCTLSPFDNLTAPTYLGRPWKEFSTTIIMQSEIGSFLHPSGWISWVSGQDPPSSIYYGEYQNTGPGSDVAQRVKWAGYNPSISETEASKYTVDAFIQGSQWLPQADVPFGASL